MPERPLLMIPGPIEVSHQVVAAAAKHPASHVAPDFIDSMGRAIENMRHVWLSGPDSQPFIVAGSGTTVMDMAVQNLVDPGDSVLVASSGHFSDRIAEMFRRRGAEVVEVKGAGGSDGRFAAPLMADVETALKGSSFKVLAATHVDTSTGVRVDAKGLCDLARAHGALTVFDGVCATAAERFEMAAWGADVYLTASQKAIGLPPGLALMVASKRALDTRDELQSKPPMSLDWHQWIPIMHAYENRKPSYFATPATSLVAALDVALLEMVGEGRKIDEAFARHEKCANAMRTAWQVLGLELLPANSSEAANTLSAIRFPHGVDGKLMGEVGKRGVIVAGGLHPLCKGIYFRVGHMGDVLNRPQDLVKTVTAIGESLQALGHDCQVSQAVEAMTAILD
ncbi:MAG: alanine-glyoxylate transaminase/serine-glyoxylate transaminase/serine-pyruvate transaminase [Planctomycetota bacterium]|jgi:alanine-glyoxylate transaminase/serine-glyoxylate transaminase/serine-pyruvate transaminase